MRQICFLSTNNRFKDIKNSFLKACSSKKSFAKLFLTFVIPDITQ